MPCVRFIRIGYRINRSLELPVIDYVCKDWRIPHCLAAFWQLITLIRILCIILNNQCNPYNQCNQRLKGYPPLLRRLLKALGHSLPLHSSPGRDSLPPAPPASDRSVRPRFSLLLLFRGLPLALQFLFVVIHAAVADDLHGDDGSGRFGFDLFRRGLLGRILGGVPASGGRRG